MPKLVKYLLLPALFCFAAVGVVYATTFGSGGSTPESQVIVALMPGPGDSVLRQSRVGIELLVGWDAELTVNGVRVPDAQHDRNLELGTITFQPGQGRALDSLTPGNNCVTATYWQLATGRDVSFERTWCFNAS